MCSAWELLVTKKDVVCVCLCDRPLDLRDAIRYS